MTTELVKLKWEYHESGTISAYIPYGEIYICPIKHGKWEVEINGTVLRAKPKSSEEAMEMVCRIFTSTLIHWLQQHTNWLDD